MSESTTNTTAAPSAAIDLATPIQFVKGVGPKRARSFERLGVATLGDLIRHLPHRYEWERAEAALKDLPADAIVSARGEVAVTRLAGVRGGRGRGGGRGGGRFEAHITDGSGGRLHLTWFNSSYLKRSIHPGMRLRVQGKVQLYYGYKQMVNPKWEVLKDEEPEKHIEIRDDRYRPVYPATEELSSDQIDKIVQGVLDGALPLIDDHLSPAFRRAREIPELRDAYRMLHRPAHEHEVDEAKRRLAFDELFMLQLGVAMKRRQLRETSKAPALGWSVAIDRHIRDRFPFELTTAQDKVIHEIRADLARDTPMNRLLQGDVGAGKTVVALYAMLMAAASRRQAALMAPTEILAEQHYLSITDMLRGSNVSIELLTATISAGERESIHRRLSAGEIDIVIGTHALLSARVEFHNLSLIVIDEQHRFGVQQRAALRERAFDRTGLAPHTLVMTATPIPRTLSLTLFGDLDISTIQGLPPGRQPITTRVVGPDKSDTVYEYVAERLRSGEQAYIVLPAIDDSGTLELKDVRSHMKWLEDGHFKGLRVASIHGRLKRETRERIMSRFRDGRTAALVATTVIEVGVDVPNASIMVVEHAERFGLSQLHQLRGRVGRGNRKSLCTFIGEPSTDDATARLKAIARTTDGFEIAEKDFEIRGMGEILGSRQSGVPPFRVAKLPEDSALLHMARRDAQALIAEDHALSAESNELLRKRLLNAYGAGLGLADVG